MAKYLLVYYGGGMADTEAERAAVMQQWGSWFGKLGKGLVDGGNPFTGKVKNIAPDGKSKDGPIGQQATGYSIIESNSLEAATELSKGCPVLKSGGQVAVYETFNAM